MHGVFYFLLFAPSGSLFLKQIVFIHIRSVLGLHCLQQYSTRVDKENMSSTLYFSVSRTPNLPKLFMFLQKYANSLRYFM